MTIASLHQLPLAEQHRALGARFAPFAGWEMPVQYAGIVEEHRAVRERAGVFDVSHMGRLFIAGGDAGRALRRSLTYKVDQLEVGEAHYALLCADDGGILDDVFVYRLDAERFLLVNNASNAELGRERLASFIEPDMDVELLDRQASTTMLAVQGAEAFEFLAPIIGADVLESTTRRRCTELPYLRDKLLIARTGYTGEDGVELITSVEAGTHLLERLLAVTWGQGVPKQARLVALQRLAQSMVVDELMLLATSVEAAVDVRAIAEENKVPMPSFFGYMLWSGVILIPVFILVTFVFLR